ncbi:MAG TPA: alpha/beta hydrolase [Streptosporangiaceae bacterium]|nr:alpha/beta hydrolase [Streptosporangiaceae bacterium]
MCSRASGSKPELASLLSAHFTVYSYDRRGRGDSGNTQPYAVEREIEDVAALIEDAGAAACQYGHSSGASLALEAAVALGGFIQEFWAWMTATQLVRASAAASLDTDAAVARALRRREASGPVIADHVPFTAARHQAVRSMTQSRVTAGTSMAALAALADDTSRAVLHTLNVHGRNRHSPRAQKARPGFQHTAATKKTVTGIPQVARFHPGTAST